MPTVGQGSAIVVQDATPGAKATAVARADGNPDRLAGCSWVSSRRLVCTLYGVVKAMLARGDRQHDFAAWFGVNGGRIGEIASGRKHRSVPAATDANLPPVGPFPNGRDATVALQALVAARAECLLETAARLVWPPPAFDAARPTC